MTSPLTRRTFLTRLLAAAGLAPLAARALAAPKVTPPAAPVEWVIPPLEELLGRSYLVQGRAIKVPSNRVVFWAQYTHDIPHHGMGDHHRYEGEWDGTFKLERGCANPAFILADLYELTGAEPDWVLARKPSPPLCAPMVMDGIHQLLKPQLDWEMLYHWGRHCDELVGYTGSDRFVPRFEINTICSTREEMIQLREDLRMHCLVWQSTDPRYRTSWPGIPYPKGHA